MRLDEHWLTSNSCCWNSRNAAGGVVADVGRDSDWVVEVVRDILHVLGRRDGDFGTDCGRLGGKLWGSRNTVRAGEDVLRCVI